MEKLGLFSSFSTECTMGKGHGLALHTHICFTASIFQARSFTDAKRFLKFGPSPTPFIFLVRIPSGFLNVFAESFLGQTKSLCILNLCYFQFLHVHDNQRFRISGLRIKGSFMTQEVFLTFTNGPWDPFLKRHERFSGPKSSLQSPYILESWSFNLFSIQEKTKLFMPCNLPLLKIQRDLCHPKYGRKVSEPLRKGPWSFILDDSNVSFEAQFRRLLPHSSPC